MITRIEGILEDVRDGAVEVRVADNIVHEVLVPACDFGDLALRVGTKVCLFTLHYFESQGQGSHFIPRLIGFRSREQRAFFELLTTVKGIGNRKALRAMQVSHARMAEAIAGGDAKFLATLPEIGKRTAESTIVELKGKLDAFLKDPTAARKAAETVATTAMSVQPTGPAADAEEVLVALGEPRAQAREKIERVVAAAHASGLDLAADEIVTRTLRSRGVS